MAWDCCQCKVRVGGAFGERRSGPSPVFESIPSEILCTKLKSPQTRGARGFPNFRKWTAKGFSLFSRQYSPPPLRIAAKPCPWGVQLGLSFFCGSAVEPGTLKTAFLGIVKGFEFPDHPGLKEHRQSLLPGSCWNTVFSIPRAPCGAFKC